MTHSGRWLSATSPLRPLILMLLVVTSGSSRADEKTVPIVGLAAEAPEIVVGDRWVMEIKGNMYYEPELCELVVTQVATDGSHVIEILCSKGKRMKTYISKTHQLTRKVDLTTGGDLPCPDPPATPLSFPLFAGKKWRDKYWALSVGGSLALFENEYEVTGLEKIQTRAGSFWSYKISQTQSANSGKDIYNNEFWFSQDAKRIIKFRPDDRGGNSQEELFSFKLAEVTKKQPLLPSSSFREVILEGSIIKAERNTILVDVGESDGVRVGDLGRVYHPVTIGQEKKRVYIANFFVTEVFRQKLIANVQEKTAEVSVGQSVEIVIRSGPETGK
jgi:hypothetical protein